ncbi:T9SS type B sorting domain-containing protein [Lacihabitans soyangensis]|uniref:T9SS type B sorting domain-containing protein n=1 Tax=Lacihabitans soyangensis TaxID=869394 RepID=UPI0020CE1CC0|nr:gliding motility-associated C-terminal domain-containing protein [Lacihabitans soyangensis]
MKRYILLLLIFNVTVAQAKAFRSANGIKIDLALQSSYSSLSNGRTSFIIKIKNQRGTLANNIMIKDILPANFQVQNIAVSKGQHSLTANTILWEIGTMASNESEHTLTIIGVLSANTSFSYNQAEITQVSEEDLDSTPNNQNPCEDDMTFITIGGNVTNCPANNLTLQLSAISGFITYSWFKNGQIINGANTKQLSVQKEGSYNFKATFTQSGQSCTYAPSDTLKISTIKPIEVETQVAQPSCGLANGSIKFTNTKGFEPIVLSKDSLTFSSENLFGNLLSGKHNIYIKDAKSCILKKTFYLESVSNDITVTSSVVCDSSTTALISLNASGGIPPYQYNDGSGFKIANQFTKPNGTFSFEVKDSKGCTKLYTTSTICPNLCADSTFKVCPDAVISQLISVPNGFKDIQWYKNDTIIIGQQAQTYTIKSPGTYTYWARKISQDSTQQKTKGCNFKMLVIPPATFQVQVTNESCKNLTKGKLEVTNIMGEAPFTFRINNSPFQSNAIFKDLNAGSYNVIVKDKKGCRAILINQKIAPDSVLLPPEITTDKQLICSFEKANLLASICQDSASIVWSNNVINLNLINVGEGTYTARCKNTCGISPPSNQIKISEIADAPIPFIDISKSVDCKGEFIKLTTNFCTGNIIWNTGEKTAIITVNKSGTYTALCEAPCGNTQASITITIQTTPTPVAPIIKPDSFFVKDGQKVILTASDCNTGNVVWSTQEKTPTIKVGPGKYFAFCETACGKSSSSDTVEIKTEKPPFSPIISASKLQICQGELVTLLANGCTGDTVLWSTGIVGKSIITKPSKTTSYFAKCKKADKLDVSNLVTIAVSDPTIPILSATKTTTCAGEPVKITAKNCLQEVIWSNDQKGPEITVAPTSATKYFAYCKDNNCESASSDTLLIGVFSKNAPKISALKSQVCQGDTIQLRADGCTGKVQWSNGSTGETLKEKTIKSGIQNYTAKCVSDALQCESQVADSLKIWVLEKVSKPTVSQSLKNTCPVQFVNLNNAVSIDSQSISSIFLFKNDSLKTAETISDPTKIAVSGIYYIFKKSTDGCLSAPSAIAVGISDCSSITKTDTVDIQVRKSANVSVADINSNVFYRIVIKNTRKTMATNVQVVDFLPQNIELIALSSNAKFKNGLIFISIPFLKIEDSVVVLYEVKTIGTGLIRNTAALITLDQTDANSENNESTVVINPYGNNSPLGLSKELIYLYRVGERLFDLSFNFKITNNSPKSLKNLQLSDDLSKIFGSSVSVKDILISTENNSKIVLNPNYSGFPPNTNLLIDSLSYINPNDTLTIKLGFKLFLEDSLKNIFYNSARIEIANDPNTFDISTDGQNPDPDNNGKTSDNNTPTLINLKEPKLNPIAVSLSVIDTTLLAYNTFKVRYMVLLKNQTNSTLTNLIITDSLIEFLPKGLAFYISEKPLVSAQSYIKTNPNFNGSSDTYLTLPTSTIKPSTQDTLIFGLTFNFNSFLGPYHNQVRASVKDSSDNTYFDISNNGPITLSWLQDTTTFYINPSTFPAETLISVPGGFSPNDDGVNDEFRVKILKNVAIDKFVVYNRYGTKIHETSNIPQNTETFSWSGKNRDTNSSVPEGTYYYAIYIKNSYKPILGFITIKK